MKLFLILLLSIFAMTANATDLPTNSDENVTEQTIKAEVNKANSPTLDYWRVMTVNIGGIIYKVEPEHRIEDSAVYNSPDPDWGIDFFGDDAEDEAWDYYNALSYPPRP